VTVTDFLSSWEDLKGMKDYIARLFVIIGLFSNLQADELAVWVDPLGMVEDAGNSEKKGLFNRGRDVEAVATTGGETLNKVAVQIPIYGPKDEFPTTYILVDYSSKTAKFYKNGELKGSTGSVKMGSHMSTVPKSNGTPPGQYTASKEPWHRFGKYTWRLSGKQGNRGILIHKKLGVSKYSRGCICPPTSFLRYVFENTGKTVGIKIVR